MAQLQGKPKDKEQDARRKQPVEHSQTAEAPAQPVAEAVNGLQRAFGNQAVQRVLGPVAAELEDALRGDADHLGDDIRSHAGRGSPLSPGVQRTLESGLGADLSNVRVHTGGDADRLAQSVQAQAFTSGSDIFFRSGAYQPESATGVRMLAHEAAHTVQQAAGPVDGTATQGGVSISHPDDRFEQAAEQAAARVAGGASEVPYPRSGSPRSGQLQRLVIQRGFLDDAAGWPDKVKGFAAVSQLDELLLGFAGATTLSAQLAALEILPGNIEIVRGNIKAARLAAYAAGRVDKMLTDLKSEIATKRQTLIKASGPSKAPVKQPQPALEPPPESISSPKEPVLPKIDIPPLGKPSMPLSKPSPVVEKPAPLKKPSFPPLESTVVELPLPKPAMPTSKPPEKPSAGVLGSGPKPSSAVLDKPPVSSPVIPTTPKPEPIPDSALPSKVVKEPGKSGPPAPVIADVTPTPVIVPKVASVVAAPNPTLMPKDEAERGKAKTRIAKGAHYLSASANTNWTAPAPMIGGAPSPAPDYDKQIREGANYDSSTPGTTYTAHAVQLVKTVGPWGFNRQMLAGKPYNVGIQSFTTSSARLATFVQDKEGDVLLRLADGKTIRTAKENVVTIDYLEVRQSDGKVVAVKPDDLVPVTVVSTRIEGSGLVLVREVDTATGETGFKALEPSQALFPEGGAKPEHIHQTGLGDCYLQSVLISIANTNPKHFERMMPDTPGQKTVTVTFYNVTSTSGAVGYQAVPITIEKSLPESAMGTALYNQGANWARLIQKAFVVFAGKHGKYGEAFKAEAPKTAGGYADIASGIEYQLYGVFYGSGVAAPASRTQSTFAAGDSDATNLLANQDTIAKLLQFKGQAVGPDEVVNLTAGATLVAHLRRAQDAARACDGQFDESKIKNLPWFKQELGKAVKQEENPANKNKTVAQKNDVKAMVDMSKEYLTGDWGPLVETIKANPDNRSMQTLLEMLLNLSQAGTDSSPGQRFIYSAHAYTIVGVAFKRANGTAFVPRIDHLADDLSQLSAAKSQVTLRNPHHGNEPNPTGAPETAEGPERGQFTLSLAQYLRNFSMLDYARVKATK